MYSLDQIVQLALVGEIGVAAESLQSLLDNKGSFLYRSEKGGRDKEEHRVVTRRMTVVGELEKLWIAKSGLFPDQPIARIPVRYTRDHETYEGVNNLWLCQMMFNQ